MNITESVIKFSKTLFILYFCGILIQWIPLLTFFKKNNFCQSSFVFKTNDFPKLTSYFICFPSLTLWSFNKAKLFFLNRNLHQNKKKSISLLISTKESCWVEMSLSEQAHAQRPKTRYYIRNCMKFLMSPSNTNLSTNVHHKFHTKNTIFFKHFNNPKIASIEQLRASVSIFPIKNIPNLL